jgi:hypothetical protein
MGGVDEPSSQVKKTPTLPRFPQPRRRYLPDSPDRVNWTPESRTMQLVGFVPLRFLAAA